MSEHTKRCNFVIIFHKDDNDFSLWRFWRAVIPKGTQEELNLQKLSLNYYVKQFQENIFGWRNHREAGDIQTCVTLYYSFPIFNEL